MAKDPTMAKLEVHQGIDVKNLFVHQTSESIK